MKPTPLTDEQIATIHIQEWAKTTQRGVEPAPFARAIEAAVHAKWQEMLSKQVPVAWMDLHKELGQFKWDSPDEGWNAAIKSVQKRLWELDCEATRPPAQPAQQELRHCACLFDESGCVEPCKLHGQHTALLRPALEALKYSVPIPQNILAHKTIVAKLKDALHEQQS